MVKRMLCLVIGIMFLFGVNGDCAIVTGGSYALVVVPDTTIGQTGYSANLGTINTNARIYCTLFTPADSGKITYLHSFHLRITGDFSIGVWDDSGVLVKSIEGVGNGEEEQAWVNLAVDSIELDGAEEYYVGIMSKTDSATSPKGEAVAGKTIRYVSATYSDPLPNFNPASLTTFLTGYELSVYGDNSSGDPS